MANPKDIIPQATFPTPQREEWIAQIRQDLKGKPYEALIWKPESGLEIAPFYLRADVEEFLPALAQAPGSSPGLRGTLWNAQVPGWQAVQAIAVDDPEAAIRRLQEAHDADVHAVNLYHWGENPVTESLITVAGQVNLRETALHLDLPKVDSEQIASLIGVLTAPAFLTGTLTNHPLTQFVDGNKLTLSDQWKQTAGIVQKFMPYPWFRSMGIDLRPAAEAGAGVTQQLALALAAISDAFFHLPGHIPGFNARQVSKLLAIRFATGSGFFLEIAKLRAFRVLYDQLATTYGIEDPSDHAPFVISETARWNLSRYDKHTNLLRNTTEALSAVIGGSQAVVVNAFDSSESPEQAGSARWARNIQHLLQYESYLDQVADPAGGAYYVEVMTDQVARQSWKLFQEIESEGGLGVWMQSGKLAEWLQQSSSDRQLQFSKRKKIQVGINQYPNPGEAIDPATWQHGPFDEFRVATAFEKVRGEADALFQHTGKRPKALLLRFGDEAMRQARSQFTRELLGIGGFEITENSSPGDLTASLAEASAAQPDVIALCSSDPDYLSQGTSILNEWSLALPNTRFLLAGKPEGWTDTRTTSVYLGMDATAFLAGLIGLISTANAPQP